jgi:flavin-binding protein dodecin
MEDPTSAGKYHPGLASPAEVAMTSITKTIRLSGQAPDSIEDAVRTVLARAAATISDIQGFRIVEVGGKVDDSGVPTVFSVTLDITFGIKDPVEHG